MQVYKNVPPERQRGAEIQDKATHHQLVKRSPPNSGPLTHHLSSSDSGIANCPSVVTQIHQDFVYLEPNLQIKRIPECMQCNGVSLFHNSPLNHLITGINMSQCIFVRHINVICRGSWGLGASPSWWNKRQLDHGQIQSITGQFTLTVAACACPQPWRKHHFIRLDDSGLPVSSALWCTYALPGSS